MSGAKDRLRAQIKRRRQQLGAAEAAGLSKQVTERLIGFADWRKVKSIHVYETIESLREVDSRPFIGFIRKSYPDIAIYRPEAEPGEPDIVIVPLVAFDKNHNRIGMGGGYYDRLLKKYPKARKIGLAYETQKVSRVPAESHDVRLDAVITEAKTY